MRVTKTPKVEHSEDKMDQQDLENGLRQLRKQGYSAEQVGGNIVVKDPVHRCGTGPYAGRLLLVGYADRTLTSANAVMKFVSERS